MITCSEVLDKLNAVTKAITGREEPGPDESTKVDVDQDDGMRALAMHAGAIDASELRELVDTMAEFHLDLMVRAGCVTTNHVQGIVSQAVLAGIFIGQASA